MHQIKINVSYIGKYIFLLIMLLPFIGISNFQYISKLSRYAFLNRFIDKLWYVNIAVILVYVLYVFLCTKRFLSVPCFLIVCIFSYLFIRTFIEGVKSQNVLTFIMFVLYAELYIFKKKENFLVFIDVLNTYVFLNFIFILRYVNQGGLTYWSVREQKIWKGYYLLGYDNRFIVVILPLICFTLILYRQTGNRKYLFALFVQLLSEILVKSAATFMALGCFGIFTLLQNSKIFIEIIYKPINIALIYTVCFYGVVVVKIQYIVSSAVYYLFHKGLDTTRWRLWNEGLEKAEKNPLWGYGYGLETFGNNYLSPHNMFLEWMTQGGVIELLGYFVLIFIVLKKLYNNIDHYAAKIIYNGIVAFMFAYMAESYSIHVSYWSFLLLLLMAARLEYLIPLFGDRTERWSQMSIQNEN